MIVVSLTTWEPRVTLARPAVEAACALSGVGRVLVFVAPQVRPAAVGIVYGTRAELHVAEDIGSGKKHLAPDLCAPDDTIVTLDDDFCYAPDHAQVLADHTERTGCVCGFQGHTRDGGTVAEGLADYLGGLCAWAYRAAWLDTADVLRWGRDPRTRDTDDVYLGAVFRRVGRGVRVVQGAKRHRWPPMNFDAAMCRESLCYHPQKREREKSALAAAWAGLEEVAA